MPDWQSFDRFAADYDRFASLEPGSLRNWLIKQLPARGHRALDAGCGAGRHTRALAERFDDVVGVDISAPLIDIASHHAGPNVRYLVGDLSFSDATGFDLVFSSTTLHHVRDLDAALMHLRDLVRPGGIAILIDNIASRPTPPRWVHVLGAVRHVPSDVRRLGWRQAAWLFTFRTSAPSLDHLAIAISRARSSSIATARSFRAGDFRTLATPTRSSGKRKTPRLGHEVRREP